MSLHRYTLEPYHGRESRYDCPACKKKNHFSRYIDRVKGVYLDPKVGRCDSEIECGYHYPPKQYFLDNGMSSSKNENEPIPYIPKSPTLGNTASEISPEILKRSLKAYNDNNFVAYLMTIFGSEITNQLISKYYIGTSKKWPGATVFWQIDQSRKIKAGKIMLFDTDTGKRVKEPYKHISWVHSILKIENYNLQQCFFGEHLLISNPHDPVAVVESEKTAIICSVYFPKLIWLASGSLANLTVPRLLGLKRAAIYLFPDLGAYEKWSKIARELTLATTTISVIVSDLLVKNATTEDRKGGLDLADYLIRHNMETNIKQEIDTYVQLPPGHSIMVCHRDGNTWEVELNEHGYPAAWDDP